MVGKNFSHFAKIWSLFTDLFFTAMVSAIIDCLVYFCCAIPIQHLKMHLKYPNQKWHKQIIYQNVHNLLFFLQMYSMNQFPGTLQKYLTKREHDRLFRLFCESSDREESNRDICLIYHSSGERDLHIVKNLITDERAHFHSRYPSCPSLS